MGLVGLLGIMLVAGALITGAIVAGQQARSGADLAALAGAGELMAGAGAQQACAVAERQASLNGTHLQTCEVSPDADQLTDATVSLPEINVVVTRAVGWGGWTATASAVAGGISGADKPTRR